ncbi:anti-phage defense-associated sirtuin Dsr1 [Solidesulfovibrio sp.]|uniref:anti-phage defense-associated sirtuin Dsr1 n=1 Tax=Solidesulfovibrio sp. TaxID=2910990 RepID=UPI00261DD7BC|nr:anti-phage defense-associated sirtuin Dsr1 [Solidesulfovibrio sp.]
MQFIKDGPDIPERLLQDHEDGRVVFFCGAGISYPAGLPGFRGLVDQIYKTLGTVHTPIEDQAYLRGQYDVTLDLLEHRFPGQRLAVRSALAKILKPKLRRKGSTDTHAALLQLAQNRDGMTRLITTNFDSIFQYLIKKSKSNIPTFPAPLLPIPKNSRWNGVIYLHGLLSDPLDGSILHRLVLTSGDFGLAYLTERWAARFVTELFRNYIVCFVGYSINDPVLRYMMDALAADRMLGENTPQAYALGSCLPGQETETHTEWEAKGVTPILYHAQEVCNDHSALHKTLKAWADTYRDGVRGKERIVFECALAQPLASTKQDDFVGRMLWAISHDSGLPAKYFANFDPVPTLDWLKHLSENRYCQDDLPRFGVPHLAPQDGNLRFCLTCRPTPYHLAPFMMLADGGHTNSRWDAVMYHLGCWLLRHLADPKLILWIVEQGCQLNDHFAKMIDGRLNYIFRLNRDGKIDEIECIKKNAPMSIPDNITLKIWDILISGHIKLPRHHHTIFNWIKKFNSHGLTTFLRVELRKLLTPCVLLKKRLTWEGQAARLEESKNLKQYISWEIVLFADHINTAAKDLPKSEKWQAALPHLVDDLHSLLRDALDLLRELEKADDLHDLSYLELPSIAPHRQNRSHDNWSLLIELLRDSWIALKNQNTSRSKSVATAWWQIPYPTFKRLALFAAAQEDASLDDQWVDWLLSNDNWWLWSIETRRETLRLLALRGAYLREDTRSRLEVGILSGPPRKMFRDDMTPKEWEDTSARMKWLRLAKLASSGSKLGSDANVIFTEINRSNPSWELATDESDEFSIWIGGTGDRDYEERYTIEEAPTKRRDLIEWLKRPQNNHPLQKDNWQERCLNNFPVAVCALCVLARENQWPIHRWHEALSAWAGEATINRAWRYIAPILNTMPQDVVQKIFEPSTWWIEALSKTIKNHEFIFLKLCKTILNYKQIHDTVFDENLADAINHPVGHITQAILNYWFLQKPEDNQGIPDNIKLIFTDLCDTQTVHYRHGRTILAANIIALFRVDHNWTEEHLIPLFNWRTSQSVAQSVWAGFLWSPRLYRHLFIALKPDFLETAYHYNDLGNHGRQYAAILTYAALDLNDIFNTQELNQAINSLPQDGLQNSAQTLFYILQGSNQKREQCWAHRIYPFWHNFWPKSLDRVSEPIANQLACLSIEARGKFPEALETLHNWLLPLQDIYDVIFSLEESGLCKQYPKDALRLLNKVIQDQPWPPSELNNCLKMILESWPDADKDPRYQKIMTYFRQHK